MPTQSELMLLLHKYRAAACEYGYTMGSDDEDQARENLQTVEEEIVEAIERLFSLHADD